MKNPKIIKGINKIANANLEIGMKGDLVTRNNERKEITIPNILISENVNLNLFSPKGLIDRNTCVKLFFEKIEICD